MPAKSLAGIALSPAAIAILRPAHSAAVDAIFQPPPQRETNVLFL